MDQSKVNFVKGLTIDVKAKVLYEFLKKGTSTRDIEKKLKELTEKDGWDAWAIIHFYGFDVNSKAKHSKITLKDIKQSLLDSNDEELETYHLDKDKNENQPEIIFTDSDGGDIFRTIKARQGQYKLRKLMLQNYKNRCAMCSINNTKLLVTSHIKTWADSTVEERIDPTNSILLCRLHDGLFENGYISLTDDYQLIYSTNFDFDGQNVSKKITFTEPIKDSPSKEFLKNHRFKHGYEEL